MWYMILKLEALWSLPPSTDNGWFIHPSMYSANKPPVLVNVPGAGINFRARWDEVSFILFFVCFVTFHFERWDEVLTYLMITIH